jgi:hypothetical protein
MTQISRLTQKNVQCPQNFNEIFKYTFKRSNSNPLYTAIYSIYKLHAITVYSTNSSKSKLYQLAHVHPFSSFSAGLLVSPIKSNAQFLEKFHKCVIIVLIQIIDAVMMSYT